MMKTKRLTAARIWLIEHGSLLNVAELSRRINEAGRVKVSRQMLHAAAVGNKNMGDEVAEEIALQLEAIGVNLNARKLPSKGV
jgi:hypothetical protein